MNKQRNWKDLYDGVKKGDRIKTGMALSLIESRRPSDRNAAAMLVNECIKTAPKDTLRVGVTGSPGVGKSSVIEKLGLEAIRNGKKVAVLAIDPSSTISGGSILGDKTRMQELSSSPHAFIRPSAAGKTLGGVTQTTREAIVICEAAGYDLVLVETVGVGQSEIAVYKMTDMFLYLVLPGAGDELQGIKRGIVEMADLVAVNKAEEDQKKLAKQTARDYKNALHLLQTKPSGWQPLVVTHSIFDNNSTRMLWDKIKTFRKHQTENGHMAQQRQFQQKNWFQDLLQSELLEKIDNALQNSHSGLSQLKEKISAMEISPALAVKELLDRLDITLKNK